MNEFPLSIRDVPPHQEATRITGTRPDGLPDGVHTGGAWEWEGRVYKPLDGRPYANCEHHYPTREAEVLEEMAGEILFPRNWRVEELNGRRWLVRPKVYVIGKELEHKDLNLDQILMVEQGVRNLNRHHWEINDQISLGVDPETYDLFILDMSAAQKMEGKGAWRADDYFAIRCFFELCDAQRIIKLRQNGSHLLTSALWGLKHPGYHHIYASFYRPISRTWATLPEETELLHMGKTNWDEATPHTWVITKEPLPQETLDKYELEWAWSPVHEE